MSYEQKAERLLEEVGDLSLSVESKSNRIAIIFSKLVDSKRNKYDVKEIEYKDVDLLGKPFSPSEGRSVDLFFDTPKGIKADQFLINDENLESIPLKL